MRELRNGNILQVTPNKIQNPQPWLSLNSYTNAIVSVFDNDIK